MDTDKLNAVFINDFKAYNTKTIDADVKINSIPNEDIGTIPILRIIESIYFESDFILGSGETLVNFKEK